MGVICVRAKLLYTNWDIFFITTTLWRWCWTVANSQLFWCWMVANSQPPSNPLLYGCPLLLTPQQQPQVPRHWYSISAAPACLFPYGQSLLVKNICHEAGPTHFTRTDWRHLRKRLSAVSGRSASTTVKDRQAVCSGAGQATSVAVISLFLTRRGMLESHDNVSTRKQILIDVWARF